MSTRAVQRGGARTVSQGKRTSRGSVIATKVHGVMRDEPNGHGLSRKSIFFEIDESLRRLGTDYVDLYQITAGTTKRPSRL